MCKTGENEQSFRRESYTQLYEFAVIRIVRASEVLPRLRKRFRSTNLLERSLEEVRRRRTVIGGFPGDTSCLSLCWAVLDIFIDGARGLGLSHLEYREIVQLKAARLPRQGREQSRIR